jgi:hypothetical protein
VEFLQHVVETRASLADSELQADELLQAIEIWSDEATVASSSYEGSEGKG